MDKLPELDMNPETSRVETAEAHEAPLFQYSVLADPEMRVKYIQLTSELVDRVLAEKPDTIVFLDKSARPVYWLMRELWPLLATPHDVDNENVKTPPMPDVKFVNIDRGVWIKKTGGLEDKEGAGVQVTPATVGREIANLRAAHLVDSKAVAQRGDEFDHPAFLDHQKIMLVDEVRVSGNTLEIAKQFYEQAFPSSTVVTEHWMHPPIGQAAGGSRFNKEVPIWYSDDSALGRGIGDLNPAANQQSSHVRIRRGNKFFSRRLEKPDTMSINLRREIRQLPHEIAYGLLPLRLNMAGLSEEEAAKRLKFMEAVNDGVSARELTEILAKTKGNPERMLKLFRAAKKY